MTESKKQAKSYSSANLQELLAQLVSFPSITPEDSGCQEFMIQFFTAVHDWGRQSVSQIDLDSARRETCSSEADG